jgi:hypothetical protein
VETCRDYGGNDRLTLGQWHEPVFRSYYRPPGVGCADHRFFIVRYWWRYSNNPLIDALGAHCAALHRHAAVPAAQD